MKLKILTGLMLAIVGDAWADSPDVETDRMAYAAVSVDDQFIARPALSMGPDERAVFHVTDLAGIEHAVEVSFPSSASSIQFARIHLAGSQTRLTPVETYPDSAETKFRTPEGAEIKVMLSVVTP